MKNTKYPGVSDKDYNKIRDNYLKQYKKLKRYFEDTICGGRNKSTAIRYFNIKKRNIESKMTILDKKQFENEGFFKMQCDIYKGFLLGINYWIKEIHEII